MAVLAPGASAFTVQKRGLFKSLAKAIVKAVVAPVAKAVVNTVAKVVAPIAAVLPPVVKQAIISVAKTAVNIAVATVSSALSFLTGSFSQTLSIPINLTVPSALLYPSPWGQQFKFYEFTLAKTDPKYAATNAALLTVGADLLGAPNPYPGIQLFCVDCGVTGDISGTGSLSISATQGFYKGSISIQGNVEAGVQVGINGFASYTATEDIPIIKTGLPGFSIPKVVTIGPSLELDIEVGIEFDAIGQVLVGTTYSWPSISATLDVIDPSQSTRSGFTPIVKKTFDVYGDVTATAHVGLPVTVAFGLDFFSGKSSFLRSVELAESKLTIFP
jgi:hypothetical protein